MKHYRLTIDFLTDDLENIQNIGLTRAPGSKYLMTSIGVSGGSMVSVGSTTLAVMGDEKTFNSTGIVCKLGEQNETR